MKKSAVDSSAIQHKVRRMAPLGEQPAGSEESPADDLDEAPEEVEA